MVIKTFNYNRISILPMLLVFYFLIESCNQKKEHSDFHPMIDGRKTEYDNGLWDETPLSDDVTLYTYQNSDHVWLSFDYPTGSYGTLDLKVLTDKILQPINLHVSAQLGEWPLDDESKIPTKATSDLWWNHNGWTANPLWVNGIDTTSYDTPEFKIKNGEIREIQMSKERFGRGDWQLKFNINAIKSEEGSFYSIRYPENEEYFNLKAK